MRVSAGGTDIGASVIYTSPGFGGQQNVYGTASATIDAAGQRTSRRSVAQGVIIRVVAADRVVGGTASGTTISAGFQNNFGTAIGTVVSAGVEGVANGGDEQYHAYYRPVEVFVSGYGIGANIAVAPADGSSWRQDGPGGRQHRYGSRSAAAARQVSTARGAAPMTHRGLRHHSSTTFQRTWRRRHAGDLGGAFDAHVGLYGAARSIYHQRWNLAGAYVGAAASAVWRAARAAPRVRWSLRGRSRWSIRTTR